MQLGELLLQPRDLGQDLAFELLVVGLFVLRQEVLQMVARVRHLIGDAQEALQSLLPDEIVDGEARRFFSSEIFAGHNLLQLPARSVCA